MFPRRAARAAVVVSAALACGVASLALAGTADAAGPANGSTISDAAQAQAPFTAGTFDSGQPIDVVVPANSSLVPNQKVFILECAAPGGVDPTTINSCDGNTAYAGGTITANSDGSVDVINSSSSSGFPYTIYALPDLVTFSEPASGSPKCGLGSANECVLYIGQGGGSDTGLSAPHFFSQAFQVHPDATDSGASNPGDGTFRADAAPGAISTANHATFTKGTFGTFSVSATGYGPPAYTEVGALPAGVSLKTTYSGVTSTGVLSGTPTQTGTFPITITASNGILPNATQSFTLTVASSGVAPVITSANSTSFTDNAAGSFQVTASGSPAPTYSETGALPPGVTFSSSGLLSGTPATTGTFPITITASNGVSPNATQGFTLSVVGFHITTSSLPNALVGSAYSRQLATAGSTSTVTWKKVSLPKGFALSTTGLLTGTPTPKVTGAFSVQVTATDGPKGTVASATIPLTVDEAPVFSTKSPTAAGFTEGTAGTATLVAAGFPTPTFSTSTPLPSGVALSSTGVLSGTPAATVNSSLTAINVTASNGISPSASVTFNLTVYAPLVITTNSLPPASVGVPYSQQLSAKGGAVSGVGVNSWKKVSLPKGFALSSTGLLTGTASSKDTSPSSVQVSITTKEGKTKVTVEKTISLVIN